MIADSSRWLAAGLSLFAYLTLCAFAWRTARQRGIAPFRAPADGAWQVVFSSQSGSAEAIARQSAAALEAAGFVVDCYALNWLDGDRLVQGGCFLFVVATSGEGEAPDNGARFVRDCLGCELDLRQIQYGLLALGDREYPHFNAFGRGLDDWLYAAGARRCFERVELDRCDADGLAYWRQQLIRFAGAPEAASWAGGEFLPWRLIERQHVNPGSSGRAVHRLRFELPAGAPIWESGDIAQIAPPGDPKRPRQYSIASLPGEVCLELLVRHCVGEDGTEGLASTWLSRELAIGQTAAIRIRPHPGFRLAGNQDRPLILIGNGVGLAGLRAHLLARIGCGRRENWLIFGERNVCADHFYRAELEAWQQDGRLQRFDAVFSRDGGSLRYVQDVLESSAEELRAWVGRGAAIYVCGSRRGMGEGVDRALAGILGRDRLDGLIDDGRYRRDVF